MEIVLCCAAILMSWCNIPNAGHDVLSVVARQGDESGYCIFAVSERRGLRVFIVPKECKEFRYSWIEITPYIKENQNYVDDLFQRNELPPPERMELTDGEFWFSPEENGGFMESGRYGCRMNPWYGRSGCSVYAEIRELGGGKNATWPYLRVKATLCEKREDRRIKLKVYLRKMDNVPLYLPTSSVRELMSWNGE